MSLQSFGYFGFLPLVALVYLLAPARFQTPILLAASLFFYWQALPSGDHLSPLAGAFYHFLPLLLAAAVLLGLWRLGLAISRAEEARRRRLVRRGVVGLLVMLALFKYYNLSFLPALFGPGLLQKLPFPLGISFFTFAAIGYLVDVGRGDVTAEESPARLGVFLFFFATVTSGPICRAGKVLPQLKQEHRFEAQRTVDALRLFALGLFKKAALADLLGLFVNEVFGNMAGYGGGVLTLALVLYTFQLYFDFCGYSEMARASALLLGIELPENFKTPFFSTNFSGFWNRWHISLSSWLQDYLFMPLVWADASRLPLIGKKYERLPATFCVFVVFFLSGFWHGNTLPFVVWGLLQALYRVGEEICHQKLGKPRKKGVKPRVLWAKRLGVFVLWSFSMVFFRVGSGPDTSALGEGFAYLAGMCRNWSPRLFGSQLIQALYAGFYDDPMMAAAWLAFAAFGFVLVGYLDHQRFFHYKDKPAEVVLAGQKGPVRWLIYYGLVLGILAGLIIQNGGFGGGASFAYANF